MPGGGTEPEVQHALLGSKRRTDQFGKTLTRPAADPSAPIDRGHFNPQPDAAMTVDLANEVARRAHTSHPLDYPVSGTKPTHYDDWFDIVHRQHKLFIANAIADIAKVFSDHGKIRSLGCGAAVNLPVVITGHPTATINMLHHEHHYGAGRIVLIQRHLSLPAQRAYLATQQFEG